MTATTPSRGTEARPRTWAALLGVLATVVGLSLGVASSDAAASGGTAAETIERSCALGKRYSSYYRKCVWWLPVGKSRSI